MSDPFSIMYDSLIASVESAEFIQPGNLIKLNKVNPLKTSIVAGDTPELILRLTSGTSPLTASSSEWESTIQWEWILTTGSYLVKDILFPNLWSLWIATGKWAKNTAGGLQFDSRTFIKNVAITDNTTGESNPEANRAIKGFVSLMTIECRCRFQRSLFEG